VSATGTGVVNQLQTAIGTIRIACKNGDLANVLAGETLPTLRAMACALEDIERQAAAHLSPALRAQVRGALSLYRGRQ
jgi:methylthioribose-1-phosphate isomerase